MAKYVKYDTTAAAPAPVLGWLDTDAGPYPAAILEGLLEITDAQWAARGKMSDRWAVSNGTLVPYTPPAPAVDTRIAAKAVLAAADITMTRVTEAVALGLTTWTTADVVAYAEWRRAVRMIVRGTSTTTPIPTMPAYPAGT